MPDHAASLVRVAVIASLMGILGGCSATGSN
jgi:hypothetical protein